MEGIIDRLRILGSRIMLWGAVAGVVFWISFSLIHRSGALVDLVFVVATSLLIGGILRIIAWLIQPRAS